MLLFDLREPINALSHGAGMLLALPVTWVLFTRSARSSGDDRDGSRRAATLYEQGKAVCLLIFGICLMTCYGISAVYHASRQNGEALARLQRLDHVGIFLLISATYTPVAWSLMRRSWSWGTLATVWTIGLSCAARVWFGGVMPMWVSTAIYLAMGWGALVCYFKLAESHSHRTLLPLPLGGVFYSTGALLNLLRWPVLIPGVFGPHEMLHFFVIAGSACHIYFMLKVVVPSPEPEGAPALVRSPRRALESRREQPLHQRGRWLAHFPTHRLNANTVSLVSTRIRRRSPRDRAMPGKDAGTV